MAIICIQVIKYTPVSEFDILDAYYSGLKF